METVLSALLVALAEHGGDPKLPMNLVSGIVLALSLGLTAGWLWLLYR